MLKTSTGRDAGDTDFKQSLCADIDGFPRLRAQVVPQEAERGTLRGSA